jgi:diguanylate cyclase (GGDEF)-like protein
MNKLAYPQDKRTPYIVAITTYTIYVVLFALLRDSVGLVIGAASILPVVTASWYFGVRVGIVTGVLCILNNIAQQVLQGTALPEILRNSSEIIGFFALTFISFVVGNLKTIIEERSHALLKLEQYEQDRRSYTDFLELLNEITGMALEANSLDSTLKILVERIGKLFRADDCFFSLWDETKGVPIPMAAYGSMSDIYPYVQFEPGEQTLGISVMEAKQPIAIPDIENSPYISPNVAAIFPSCSMLGIPLIAQQRGLGLIVLGYNKTRSFDESDLIHARLTAEQVALVLSKSLLLEEERKQVKQLTALHDIALISTEVDNEDQLINRVTDIIGQNLFLDNFGILLLDEQVGILSAHPSYRFFSTEEVHTMDVPLGEGITGQVAQTGKPLRIGNVRYVQGYLDVDDRTISELCVPIKFKERVLGVINAESTKRDAFTEDDERLLTTLAGQIATAMEQIHKAQAERKWLDQLAHSNELIYALAQITTHIEKAFSIDDIIQNLGRELNEIDLTCIVAAYDKESDLFTIHYTSLKPQFLEIIENSLGYPLIKYSFPGDKLNPATLLYPTVVSNPVNEIQSLFTQMHRKGISEVLQKIEVGANTQPLRLPLTFEENLLGVLWIWGKELTKGDLPIMSIFAKQIGISLERARLFQEVQSLALTDPLTGLHNRRSLFELGRIEFARAHRMNRAFCCMMIDLDHFKKINDTYGHLVGDQVLKEFAQRCKTSVREVDLVGRYGGEELVILLPETDRKTAMRVAERLRASVAATPIKISETEIAVTVSIGVAEKDENTLQLDTLIARADQAMYIAKHKGRNCVAMSK